MTVLTSSDVSVTHSDRFSVTLMAIVESHLLLAPQNPSFRTGHRVCGGSNVVDWHSDMTILVCSGIATCYSSKDLFLGVSEDKLVQCNVTIMNYSLVSVLYVRCRSRYGFEILTNKDREIIF